MVNMVGLQLYFIQIYTEENLGSNLQRRVWKMSGDYKYNQLLCVARMRKSTVKRDSTIAQFYSDRSRILYSSSFRRLQQKAQVFSLEPNASVRTRLTHSLEVSDLGRTLANRIAYRLSENHFLDSDKISDVVAIVENACLLHDIGNPPFGHFGEIAIRDWADISALEALPKGISRDDSLPIPMLDVSHIQFGRDISIPWSKKVMYADGSNTLIRNSMKVVEEELQPFAFLRVNNRCMINLLYLQRVNKNEVLLRNGHREKITGKYLKEASGVLDNWLEAHRT